MKTMTSPSKPRRRNEKRAHYLPKWKKTGAAIKALRTAQGLTSGEMAEALGVSKGYYNHLEQGYDNPRNMSPALKRALAKKLKVSYEALWGD